MGRIFVVAVFAGGLACGSLHEARADHRASDYAFVLTPSSATPGSTGLSESGAGGTYGTAGAAEPVIVQDQAGRLLMGTPGYRIETHGGRGYISQSPRYYYLPPAYGSGYGFYGSPRPYSGYGYRDGYYSRYGYGSSWYGSRHRGSGFSLQYSSPGFSIGIGNGAYRYGGFGYGGYGRRGYEAFGPGYRGPGVW